MNNNMKDDLEAKYLEWIHAYMESHLTRTSVYCNPMLCSVSDAWESSAIRLMVCGREGNGEISKDNNGKPIDFKNYTAEKYIKILEKNNTEYVDGTRVTSWIDKKNNLVRDTYSFNENNQAFARTFRLFRDLGVPIIWNECDKICHVDNDGYNDSNALGSKENRELHSIGGFDILEEEIKILRPTHIVFLGYWRMSLGIKHGEEKGFFPKDYEGKEDRYDTGESCQMNVDNDDIHAKVYYFSHPQYKGENYSNAIQKAIKDIKKDIDKYQINVHPNTLDEKDYKEE